MSSETENYDFHLNYLSIYSVPKRCYLFLHKKNDIPKKHRCGMMVKANQILLKETPKASNQKTQPT